MSFGITELTIILFIIILTFGTKKLRGLGYDFGTAIKSFREATNDGINNGDNVEKNNRS